MRKKAALLPMKSLEVPEYSSPSAGRDGPWVGWVPLPEVPWQDTPVSSEGQGGGGGSSRPVTQRGF